MTVENRDRDNSLPKFGNVELLSEAATVILNSSQGKQPKGSDSWVRRTKEAIDSLDPKSPVLTSVGLNTWELSCHLASQRAIPQICLVPFPAKASFESICEEVLGNFEMDLRTTCLVGLPYEGRSKKETWMERDAWILRHAAQVLAVSIREGGRLAHLIEDSGTAFEVDNRYRTAWVKSPPRREIPLRDLNDQEKSAFEGWVFHWTRAADGPWPGEPKAEYYRDLLASVSEYCRSARKTLERIVGEKRIRASSRRIRGKAPAVAFTSLPPCDSAHLFTWRKRYTRFNAEPYGIGISPNGIRALGIQPVRYVEEGESVPGVPEYLLQSRGRVGDWPAEKEFRHLGEVDLSGLADKDWQPIVLEELA